MPLSEHEQRVLEQIERSLYADDPKFAATVRGIEPKARQRRRYLRAAIGVILGIVLLPVGIAIGLIVVGFAGFLLALASFLYGVAMWRRGPDRGDSKPRRRGLRRGRAREASHGLGRQASVVTERVAPKRNVMQRFEDRWNRRRDDLAN